MRIPASLPSIAMVFSFATGAVCAQVVLPTNPHAMTGIARISTVGSTMTVATNANRSMVNWQSFSIGSGAAVNIQQPGATSAILNRVVGSGGAIDPSLIMGTLQSNGRVFLLNPSGIVFGSTAQVDVAGLVASSLNLSNADFLAGRLSFTAVPGAGAVVNQGTINTSSGGQIYLVGPAVTNSGIITSPQGEVILAAGNTVELVDPGTPNLRVEITAPDNEAKNLGSIIAQSGRVGIYAGLIDHSGTIRADSAVATEDRRIVLKATKNTTVEAGSILSANGPSGGQITIQSGDTTLVSGAIEATGSAGNGGTVHVLGNFVGLEGNASINVSGETGGGTVLVGGDSAGSNADVQNAFRTSLGPNAMITANAISNGNGGKVVLWSEDATRMRGSIRARGGAQSGNGGFVQVSSRRFLDFQVSVDTSSAGGSAVTLSLDSTEITLGNLTLDSGNLVVTVAGNLNIGSPVFVSGSDISIRTAGKINFSGKGVVTTSGNLSPGAGSISIASGDVTLTTTGNISIAQQEGQLTATQAGGTGTIQPGGVTFVVGNGITVNAASGTVLVNNVVVPLSAFSGLGPVTLQANTNVLSLLPAGQAAIRGNAQIMGSMSTISQVNDFTRGLGSAAPQTLASPRTSLTFE